ncbi:MAG: TIGR03936 family radical SAM-associated protein [Streptosporangiaceae bacterium]
MIKYAKRGRMRFASHRDIARAVERGVRRASLPVAHSAGFSPHPKISYSGGAPTGAASEAEYMEISLTASVAPDAVRARLDAALPEGIDVIEVTDLAVTQAPRLEASQWQVVLPGVAAGAAASAVQAFLAAAHAEVERLTSNGVRRLDTRAGVVSLELDRRAMAEEHSGCAILRMVVRHLTPAVRPEDILVAFRHMSALEPASPAVVTRLAQGPLGIDAAAAEASVPDPDVLAGSAGQSGSPAPAGPSGAARTAEAPRPDGRDAAQVQVLATCLDAGGAGTAYAAPVSAYEQLPRGAERPDEAGCAREPDGRDRPNARDRATEQRVSS